jgi:hypothetical protein
MADGDREVLSSLPRTRPERRSAKRGARTPAKPKAAKTQPRTPPKATRKAAPKAVPPRDIPPAGYAVPKTSSPVSAGGAELIGTAIQAVGELASLGTRALRGALGRIPKA